MIESTESSSVSDGFTQCNSEHISSSDAVTAGSGDDNHLKRVDGVETRRSLGRRSLLLGGRMYLLFHIIPVFSASVLFWIELDTPPSQYRNETNVSRRLLDLFGPSVWVWLICSITSHAGFFQGLRILLYNR